MRAMPAPLGVRPVAGDGDEARAGGDGVPVMPSARESADLARHDAVRAFHVTGRRPVPTAEGLLWPALAEDLADPGLAWSLYPLVLPARPDDPPRPLARVLDDAFDAMERETGSPPLIARLKLRLAAAVNATATEAEDGLEIGAALESSRLRLGSLVDASDETLGQLGEELDRLARLLPTGAILLPLEPMAHRALLARLVERESSYRRERTLTELRRLAAGLEELLAIEEMLSPDAAAPDKLTSALGSVGSRFVDTGRLSAAIPRRSGSERMSAERRARVERNLSTLRAAVDELGEARWHLVRGRTSGEGGWGDAPGSVTAHDDPFEAAIGIFDELAAQTVELVRAARRARLELAHAYEKGRHEPVLERLDWQGLTRAELLLVPQVVVLTTTADLRREALGSFSELLRSSRPVRVVVEDPPRESGGGGVGALSDYQIDPAYLAIAHREALVLRSTLADPEHLSRGLSSLIAAPRPAVAVVAVPGEGQAPLWVQLLAARHGRATPSLLHDPDAGRSWADRFDLSGNPDPDLPWPLVTLRWRAGDGQESAGERPFTFAETAALFPAFAEHFLRLDVTEWCEEQVEMGEWLALSEESALESIPFVWLIGRDGTLERAAVTRELAFATRDRQNGWHVLQELAGRDNEHVRRAIESVRRSAREQAERERAELVAHHEEELERVRTSAAAEAIERLAAALLDSGVSLGSATAAAAPSATIGGSEPGAVEVETEAEAQEKPPEQEVVVEEELLDEEPYIVSALCTSCNDCININSRLFRYNAEKQAYIADATAGTYEQLVKAAEKCPARCIHPGSPRPDDASVTEELLERAKALR